MDAFAIRDEQGNPIVDNGYLSFICEGEVIHICK